MAALRLLNAQPQLIDRLHDNVAYFRKGLKRSGFDALESPTAIVPVIVGDTAKAIQKAKVMLDQGVLITGFGYPVVPEGKARLRAQVSAAHTQANLDKAIDVLANPGSPMKAYRLPPPHSS